ncbi:MAG: putative HIT-like protein [Fimbriimonadales bacterium]
MDGCIFCKIASKEAPSQYVHETEYTVAFRDLNPVAPSHILIIPKRHILNLDAASAEDATLLGEILLVAAAIARSEGFAENGYRVVLNVGPDGGQTVGHLHAHLLAGRHLTWPPG